MFTVSSNNQPSFEAEYMQQKLAHFYEP